MRYSEYYNDDDIYIDNRIYNIIFRITDEGIYVLNYSIKPDYQGRHKNYTKRIFTSLCKKYNAGIYFECFAELIPFYKKIGAFYTTNSPFGLVEMYFDPFDKMF